MKKLLLISCLWSLMAFNHVSTNSIFNASLTITVRDEAGNTVAGAIVQLYEKEDNYLKEVNAIRKDTTNKKGVVKFKKLDEISYFILAKKGDINNAGGGERIGKLKKGRVNKITVIIQ